MNYKLTAEQRAAIIEYLATRPWGEVNNLITVLAKLEKIEEMEKAKTENNNLIKK